MGGRGAKSHITFKIPIDRSMSYPYQDGSEIQRGSAKTPSGYTFSDVSTMTDAEMASVVQTAKTLKLPDALHDDLTQRIIYALGMNGKPTIVPEATLRNAVAQGATALYRTVNPATNSRGQNLTAVDVANDIRYGGVFNTGGWGGQAYGGGMYMSDSHSGSRNFYGNGTGAHTVGGVFNTKARVATDYQIKTSLSAFYGAHKQLSAALGISSTGRANRQQMTTTAILMGYTGVQYDVGGGESYYTIFDRSSLTLSKKNYRSPI